MSINNIFVWPVVTWDKLTDCYPFCNSYTPFYVRYKDGNRSILMSYESAKNLAEVYGGKVWHKLQEEV